MKRFFLTSFILGLVLITVLSGCGGSGGGGNITYNYYAYVANFDDASISIYTLNPASGALSSNLPNYPITGSGSHDPGYLVVHPAQNFLYIICNDTVRTCQINPATGALTQIDTDTVSGGGLWRAAISPKENYLYVASGPGSNLNLYCFNIGTDGKPAPFTSGSPISLPGFVYDLKAAPDGSNLYVLCNDSGITGKVSAYTISPNGTLSLGTTSSVIINSPAAIAVNSSNKFIYTVRGADGTINRFKDGPALTDNGISPGGAYSRSVICAGNFLYKTNLGNDTLSCFNIANDGTLSSLGSTVATGDGPWHLAVAPNGDYLYVLNEYAKTIWGYNINSSTGILNELSWPSKPVTGNNPQLIVTAKVH